MNSSSYVFDWRNRKLTDLRSACLLVDVNSESFKEVFMRGGFRRLTPWPYMHIWADPSPQEMLSDLKSYGVSASEKE